MFGIVSNLRKVSKAKLRELGHETGLEPEDRAGGTTGVFFYKASYHNYFIVHPPADEMEANGIPWKGVFSFHKARAEQNKEKEDMKATLRTYMTKKAKELGIPIDESLPNGGFVEEPNDVMGFDFSEFYNCEKSAACMVPPLTWNTDVDDEWVSALWLTNAAITDVAIISQCLCCRKFIAHWWRWPETPSQIPTGCSELVYNVAGTLPWMLSSTLTTSITTRPSTASLPAVRNQLLAKLNGPSTWTT